MKLLILILLLSSCGIKHKISGAPKNLKVTNEGTSKVEVDKIEFDDVQVTTEPVEFIIDFDKASDICDQRYGQGTEESNDCFEKVLSFFDSEISLNLDGLVEFCKKQYPEDEEALKACVENLQSLFDTESPEPTEPEDPEQPEEPTEPTEPTKPCNPIKGCK